MHGLQTKTPIRPHSRPPTVAKPLIHTKADPLIDRWTSSTDGSQMPPTLKGDQELIDHAATLEEAIMNLEKCPLQGEKVKEMKADMAKLQKTLMANILFKNNVKLSQLAKAHEEKAEKKLNEQDSKYPTMV